MAVLYPEGDWLAEQEPNLYDLLSVKRDGLTETQEKMFDSLFVHTEVRTLLEERGEKGEESGGEN
jgi:hypothetical protein